MKWTWQRKTLGGLWVVALASGCSSNPAAAVIDAGIPDHIVLHTNTCAGEGFRELSEAGAVICPGTPSCSCSDDQVCCLQTIDTQLPGTCEDLGGCRTSALACAGPEACGGSVYGTGGTTVYVGGVCCLDTGVGGGAACRTSFTQCPSHEILCHTDNDCLTTQGYPFCRPADFGTQGVADRQLDGLIGICSSS
jgi:hypothetical protein